MKFHFLVNSLITLFEGSYKKTQIRELLGDKISDKQSDSKDNDLVEDTAETIRESGRVRLFFSYEEAVEEIKRLNQEGLNNTQIANELAFAEVAAVIS